jgi:hypothetical protein
MRTSKRARTASWKIRLHLTPTIEDDPKPRVSKKKRGGADTKVGKQLNEQLVFFRVCMKAKIPRWSQICAFHEKVIDVFPWEIDQFMAHLRKYSERVVESQSKHTVTTYHICFHLPMRSLYRLPSTSPPSSGLTPPSAALN